MSDKTNVKNLQKGEYLSEIQFYQVQSAESNRVHLINERQFPISVGNEVVSEGMYSASQYTEEVKVSRTELIEILSKCWSAVFTVCFNKQPKAKDITEVIKSLNKGKFPTTREIETRVKQVYKGEERILIGYLQKVETGFGRSQVIDLEIEKKEGNYDNRLRQIDHRTLKWLIYQNVKYIVK